MKISEYTDLVLTGKSNVRALVEEAISKAEAVEDKNVFLSILKDEAIERASLIDEAMQQGAKVGPLAGVPFVVKDNFLVKNTVTTAASKMLKEFEAPITATAIQRLEEAGAICIGKTNLDAFAHGGSTENSHFGPSLNAHNNEYVPGGSSGGSAVATALEIGAFALGTDTGGSIRQPASFNGVYGIKPSYGAVSRYGVVAMASSADTIGCFANSAEDVEIVMNIMAGRDINDMNTLPDNLYAFGQEMKEHYKIGLIKDTMTEGVDDEVRQATKDYVERLRSMGHTVEEVELPISKYALAMYYIIVPAEISSNLARYDGIRYGYRDETASSLSELYGLSRSHGFEAENKRRILIGSFVLSSGYFDAYYQKAQKARTLLRQEYDKLFADYDLLLTPTAPSAAFKLGQNTHDPMSMYLADVMTVPVSLAGLPALNVPAGINSLGLPIGVQLIADYKHDGILMDIAKKMEVM